MKPLLIVILLMMPLLINGQQTNPFDVDNRGQETDDTPSASYNNGSDTGTSQAITVIPTMPHVVQQRSNNPFDNRSQSYIPDTIVKVATMTQESQTLPSAGTPIVTQQMTKIYDFVLAILSVIILSLCILMNRKQFINILKSTVNTSFQQNKLKSGQLWKDPQYMLLYTLFFLNASFFAYSANRMNLIELKLGAYPLWLSLILAIALTYLIRHIIMTLISYIFELGRGVDQYNLSIGLHNIVFGVLILPFIFGMEFGPHSFVTSMFYGGLILWVVIYLLRQLKGILLSTGIRSFNLIYFFLYLCAVEISPILIGIRIFLDGAL